MKRVHNRALEQMDGDEDAVGHLCALYRAIARGSFCSHAFHFLFVRSSDNNTTGRDGELVATDNDIANGILPRISKLLQYLAMDPMRVAFSPLPQQPLNNGTSTVEEAVKIYNGEEDLGATIAVLLNLLQDDHLRLAAVYDLINLSNDLCTIDESNALFEPPISSPDKEEGEGGNGDKIRVHAFTEVVRILRKQSMIRILMKVHQTLLFKSHHDGVY